jgi:hypothetical protein
MWVVPTSTYSYLYNTLLILVKKFEFFAMSREGLYLRLLRPMDSSTLSGPRPMDSISFSSRWSEESLQS